jgi:hypothetical protein
MRSMAFPEILLYAGMILFFSFLLSEPKEVARSRSLSSAFLGGTAKASCSSEALTCGSSLKDVAVLESSRLSVSPSSGGRTHDSTRLRDSGESISPNLEALALLTNSPRRICGVTAPVYDALLDAAEALGKNF